MVTKYFVQYWNIGDEQAALIIRDAISRTYGFTVGQNLFTVVANDIVPTGIGVGYTIGQYLINPADNNIIVSIGGQGANPFFAKLANANLINRIQSEGQATIEIEENYKYGTDLLGMPMYVKKIFAVAGWSTEDTMRAANYIAANGLPMVSLTVPATAVQLLPEQIAVSPDVVQTAPVGSTISHTFTAVADIAANPNLNTEDKIRAFIQANINNLYATVNAEMKRRTSNEVYVKNISWSFYPDYAATLTAQNWSKPIGHIDFELVETASPVLPLILVLAIIAAITVVISITVLSVTIIDNQTKQKLISQGVDAQAQIQSLAELRASGKITEAEYLAGVEAIKSTYKATTEAVAGDWLKMIPLVLVGVGALVVLWFMLPMITKAKK